MSKPSLREQLRRRKEARTAMQPGTVPIPRIRSLGHVVAKLKRRGDELEIQVEEQELDGIMSEAEGWAP